MTIRRLVLITAIAIVLFLIGFALGPPAQLGRPTDFYFEVGVGNVLNHFAVNIAGRNTDVDPIAVEDIWDGGGVWSEPTIAQTYVLTSTSPVDTVGGTGARTVQVFGLDEVGLRDQETITLNGSNPVTTTKAYELIYQMVVKTVGSGGVNAGTITALAAVDETVTAQIEPGNNKTLMAIYKVPAGLRACIENIGFSIDRAVTANVSSSVFLYVKPPGEAWKIEQVHSLVASGTNYINRAFAPPPCYTSGSLLKLSIDSSHTDTNANGSIDLILRPN